MSQICCGVFVVESLPVRKGILRCLVMIMWGGEDGEDRGHDVTVPSIEVVIYEEMAVSGPLPRRSSCHQSLSCHHSRRTVVMTMNPRPHRAYRRGMERRSG
jgi:hypothetical protein